MKLFAKVVFALFSIAFLCGGCVAEHNDASSDLQSAFQAGCSTAGTLTEVALAHTSSIKKTIENLQKQSNCAGIGGALDNIQNLNAAILAMHDDPTTAQLKTTVERQQYLLLQIKQTSDPNLQYLLTTAYATNAVQIASLQGMQRQNGGSSLTPLQQGYTQVTRYLNDLLAGQADLSACARENPLLGAQMGAGLLAVAGTFASPATGAAVSVAGNLLNDVLEFAHNKVYSDAINDLNLIGMSDALACGLESMSNVYCQADDLMSLTHLQECSYNSASSSDCPPSLAGGQEPGDVNTTQFWKGLDVLSRQVPALQLWVQDVVSGTIAADVYDAGRQNDPSAAVELMNQIRRNADGWEQQEKRLIESFSTDAEKHTATVKALSTLVSILACNSTSQSASPFGSCVSTPVLSVKQSTAAILYELVGQPLDCTSNAFGGNCQDANSILLPGDKIIDHNRINGNGGWDAISANEKALFNTIYQQVSEQRHQALDTDPGRVLEAAKISRGIGLPSAFKAMGEISAFLRESKDYFSKARPELLDGGESARAGILNLLDSTAEMIESVAVKVLQIKGDRVADGDTLKSIYDTLSLAKDPDFINQRLKLHIQDDLNTRIKAGDAPKNVDDILRAGARNAASQLSGVPSSQIDLMYANLGGAQTKSRLNLSAYVHDFSGSLAKVIGLLKDNADKDGEPQGGNPRTAPFRSSQTRICILIASTQAEWPSEIDPALCAETFYKSELTGQVLSFDQLYATMGRAGKNNAVSQRICTFSNFFKTSAKFTQEKTAIRR